MGAVLERAEGALSQDLKVARRSTCGKNRSEGRSRLVRGCF